MNAEWFQSLLGGAPLAAVLFYLLIQERKVTHRLLEEIRDRMPPRDD